MDAQAFDDRFAGDYDPQDYLKYKGLASALDKKAETIGKPVQPPKPSQPAQQSPQSTTDLGGAPPYPADPKLQDMPKAPEANPGDPFSVFKDPMVVLAGLSSIFTRHPLTTAMNAAAEAMDGYNKGRKDIYEQKKEQFNDQVKAAMEQNQVELTKYKAAWDKRGQTVQDKFAQLYAEAAGNNDPVLSAAIKSGDTAIVEKIIAGREAAQTKLNDAYQMAVVKADVAAQTKTSLSSGTIRFLAQQAMAGDTSWKTGLGRGIQGKADIDAVEEEVRRMSDDEGSGGAELAQRNVLLGAEKGAAKSVLTRVENLEGILNTVKQAAPQALAASEAVERGGGTFVPVNRAIQMAQQANSDPSLKRFAVANMQLAELWARAMNPTGVMRVEDREIALGILDKATSKETYKAAVDSIIEAINREKAGARTTIGEMSGPAGGLTPKSRSSAPVKVQSLDEAHKLAPGTHYITPDGQEIIR